MKQGDIIRSERRKNNITQTELARAIGHKSSNSYISSVESGNIEVSLRQFNKIMEALNSIIVNTDK